MCFVGYKEQEWTELVVHFLWLRTARVEPAMLECAGATLSQVAGTEKFQMIRL